MSEQYIMALDQGTTSSRCILFDRIGNIKGMAQKEFAQIYPEPSWVEHDPMEIWSSQIGVATEAMAKSGVTSDEINAIGITNQRETTIVWNKMTGKPVYNAIVWQCRRTADRIDKLISDGYKDIVKQKTGLVPDAYFSATKICWILDHVEGARKAAERGELLFGTVDTWLIWNLTKGAVYVTDYTNASRTMLYDIKKLCWDEELLHYFNIPRVMLPEVKPSSCVYGITDKVLPGREIKIGGAAGDQQAALFGQCCFDAGEVKNTYGTGCFLLMNTGSRRIESENGLLTTIAASSDENIEYALEGSVFAAGAAIQWLRDEQCIIRNAAETEEIAKTVKDTGGVYFVPAFTGLGAPYWNPYARGMITGITRGFNRAQLVRTVLEAIAYQAKDVIKAMEEDSHIPLKNIKADGGASANNFLMQFQADILDTEVKRPVCVETTALGAAYLAGLATGFYKDKEEIKKNWVLGKQFKPSMAEHMRIKQEEGWHRAVKCALAYTNGYKNDE